MGRMRVQVRCHQRLHGQHTEHASLLHPFNIQRGGLFVGVFLLNGQLLREIFTSSEALGKLEVAVLHPRTLRQLFPLIGGSDGLSHDCEPWDVQFGSSAVAH